MVNWFKYPFIRLLMPFVLGIWLSFSYLNLSEKEVQIVLIAVILLGVTLMVIASVVKDYRYRWIFGMLLNLHLILIGKTIKLLEENRGKASGHRICKDFLDITPKEHNKGKNK